MAEKVWIESITAIRNWARQSEHIFIIVQVFHPELSEDENFTESNNVSLLLLVRSLKMVRLYRQLDPYAEQLFSAEYIKVLMLMYY